MFNNAIIYARYSSERQNEQSIESQLRICNEYARHNGLNIIDSYIDKAMTGTNDNRPAFQKMLSDCERSGAFEIVLVYAIDRFGRNSIEIAVNKQRLKKNGNNVMTATEEGIINPTTKTRMAELERQIDELSGKILIEENKLENRLTREDVKEYLTHGVRDLSPQALIELLVHRIELYDDKIIIWFNYTDRTDPDDHDTDRRGFLLSDKYSATATNRFVIIEVNTLFIAINPRKKKTAPIFGTDDKKIPNRSLSGSTGLLLVDITGVCSRFASLGGFATANHRR